MKKFWAVLTTSALVALTPILGSAAGQPEKSTPATSAPLPKQVDSNRDKIFDNLADLMSQKGSAEKIPVIVLFNESFSNAHMQQLKSRVGDFQESHTYSHALQGFAASMTKGQIQALQHVPFVQQIEYDMPVQADLDKANYWFGTTKAKADFGVTGDRDGIQYHGCQS